MASELESGAIDPLELRKAFGTFVTGVTIVTTRDESGSPRGMTANSFTSVSLAPPLLLVCIGRTAGSFPVFTATDSFAVNVLHDRQKDLAGVFASRSASRFSAVSHYTAHTGAPVLSDCLTWFDCTVHDRVESGDHIILIGRIRAFGTSTVPPLGFCRGRYVSVEDHMPPGWFPSHRMIIAHLVEHDGRILLHKDASDRWSLPTTGRRRAGNSINLDGTSTIAALSDNTFLYSVFDVADNGPGFVVYRSTLSGTSNALRELPPSLKFFAPDELPWEHIPLRQIRALLRRYLHERREARFGIYVDSSDGGHVAMIDGAPRSWRTMKDIAADPEPSSTTSG